jgi:hypothetical protein
VAKPIALDARMERAGRGAGVAGARTGRGERDSPENISFGQVRIWAVEELQLRCRLR